MALIFSQLNGQFAHGHDMGLNVAAIKQAIQDIYRANDGRGKLGEEIDVGLLHRDPKLKSGFKGVLVHSSGGWRAEALVDGCTKLLGVAPTATEAAWERRQFYITNGLPYGELETQIEELRKQYPSYATAPLEVLIEEVRKHAEIVGLTQQTFGPGSATVLPPGYDEVGNRIVALPAAPGPQSPSISAQLRLAATEPPKIEALGFKNGLPAHLDPATWTPGAGAADDDLE